MYRALYRKWRPQVFGDVAGQPHITKTLRNEIASGRVAHAYLFTGSRGTGKTACAKIFAKAVNCLNPHDGDPCGKCENCRGIDDGTVLDVVEIDAASNNGVDSIRDLREETAYTPARAKYRVYIIDEAHMLSQGAFNALLKTLEEPPSYVIFILATTEAHKIPATIMSRCQRFDFRRIPVSDMVKRLKFVAENEKIELTDDGAALISRLSDGALRDALSLLDQCAGTEGPVDEKTVSKTAGLVPGDYLFEIARAVEDNDAGKSLCILDGLYEKSLGMDRLCVELTGFWRDIMVAKASDSNDLMTGTADYIDKVRDCAGDFSPESVLHILDTLEKTQEELKSGETGRVIMETCLVRLCLPELDNSKAALLRRISNIEERLKSPPVCMTDKGVSLSVKGETAVHEEEKARRSEKPDGVKRERKPERTKVAVSGTEDATRAEEADRPLDKWPEVIAVLKKTDPALAGLLNGARAFVRGDHVLIDTGNGIFPRILGKKEQKNMLIEAVRRVTGQNFKVGIISKKETGDAKGVPSDNSGLDEIIKNADENGIPYTVDE